VEALKRIADAAPDLGIGVLTVYAFSADNWKRPAAEIAGLMRLLRMYMRREKEHCIANGIRIQAIGKRDRLDAAVIRDIGATERETAAGRRLLLRIALDYSSRKEILKALEQGTAPGPDVDLLIRTSGEQRLSDFLLWECAYAELYFTSRLWPDFGPEDLAAAVKEFHRRERRFGALPEAAAS
jgi:undecaprenyl diphosphate synthase